LKQLDECDRVLSFLGHDQSWLLAQVNGALFSAFGFQTSWAFLIQVKACFSLFFLFLGKFDVRWRAPGPCLNFGIDGFVGAYE
jgi:lipoprotein signal peptidase